MDPALILEGHHLISLAPFSFVYSFLLLFSSLRYLSCFLCLFNSVFPFLLFFSSSSFSSSILYIPFLAFLSYVCLLHYFFSSFVFFSSSTSSTFYLRHPFMCFASLLPLAALYIEAVSHRAIRCWNANRPKPRRPPAGLGWTPAPSRLDIHPRQEDQLVGMVRLGTALFTLCCQGILNA